MLAIFGGYILLEYSRVVEDDLLPKHFYCTNLEMFRKSLLKRTIFTPDIRPEIDSGPSLTSKEINLEKLPHSFVMFFQRLTPYGPKTSLEHHPPCILPYLISDLPP
jgi:hypothetical protein